MRIHILLWVFSSYLFAEPLSQKVLDQVKTLQEEGAKKGWTFEVGYNDAMSQPLKNITGLKFPKNWRLQKTFYTEKVFRASLPSKFDWRTEGNGLPEIKNQGSCGSCWAFGTVATLESIMRIRDNSRERLSEQQLVSCDRGSYGCQGGFFAHDYHVSPGAALDSDFPYRAQDISCRPGLVGKAKITDWAYVGGSDQKRPTVEQIKQAIFDHGPVNVIVHANSSMQAYQGGVYNNCVNAQENHMVNLVGWDDAGGYWIMRNSWGKNWGENGYMKIKYGCSNIASVAAFVNYKSTACSPMPTVYTGENLTIKRGDWVSIGAMPVFGQTYQWSPEEGLDDATASMPIATPDKTTVYTLKVQNRCGISEKQIKITVN